MAEIKTLVDNEQISYHGLIDAKGLYKMIDRWFQERSYDKEEMKNYEEVYPEGKQLTLEIKPYKKISDYVKFEIRIFMVLRRLQPVEIERDGRKIKLMKGDAFLSFDAYMITDYEGKWESRAVFYFLRTVFDKIVYKSYMAEHEAQLISECSEVRNEIKAFLNMHRY